MRAWEWFLGLFNKDTGKLSLDAYVGSLAAEVFYKELAIQACINLISNTVSMGEFLTYEKGDAVRRDNYYLFNVEPNQNKSAGKFWRDVISRLVYSNECLVIQEKGMFYVADSFEVTKFAFKDNVYKDIVIEDYQLNNVYFEPQVFHFELHDEKIKTVIDGLYKSYSKLIQASSTGYRRSKAKRGVLELKTRLPATEEARNDLQDLLSNKFKKYFEAEGGAVLPLTKDEVYKESENTGGSRGGIEGREIRAFIDDIFDFVAIGFQVPPQLIKGGVTNLDRAWDSFLTVPINPLAKILTEEINRKFYGKEAYLERTYVKLDTTRIKAVNIKEIANALDILTRIGAYCVDDSLKALGMEPLDTEWSKVRWMTKNYELIERLAKGGE